MTVAGVTSNPTQRVDTHRDEDVVEQRHERGDGHPPLERDRTGRRRSGPGRRPGPVRAFLVICSPQDGPMTWVDTSAAGTPQASASALLTAPVCCRRQVDGLHPHLTDRSNRSAR